MNSKKKLDIMSSILNKNIESQEMAKCPYCTDLVEYVLSKDNLKVEAPEVRKRYQDSIHTKNFLELELDDIVHYKKQRDFFFEKAYLTRCCNANCGKSFYIVYQLQTNGTGKSEYSLKKEIFEYIRSKYYTPQELVRFLPTEELIERYNSLQNAISVNDKHLKNMALRVLIDAEVAHSRNEPENKHLSTAIKNAEFLEQDVKDFLEHLILPNNNNSAHSKLHKKAEEKFTEIGIFYMDLYFTEKYKHTEERKEADRIFKEQTEKIKQEKLNLINSVKHIIEEKKSQKISSKKGTTHY